jgi:CO/xanthine dehydrogenase Mo-binding subunit
LNQKLSEVIIVRHARPSLNTSRGSRCSANGGSLVARKKRQGQYCLPGFIFYDHHQGRIVVPVYIAVVAEVEVKRSTGEIRARKFFVLHDCGQIINPDGVQSQIEGNIIQTVSRTLKEELTFSRSAVTSLDWASYPILTFLEVPDIIIDLIDRPAEKPWGAGEPSAAVVHRRSRMRCSMRPACGFVPCAH